MASFSSEEIPERDPQSQILKGAGELLVARGPESWKITGISRERFEQVLALVDGRRSVAEIVAEAGAGDARGLLDLMNGKALRRKRLPGATSSKSGRLAGSLAHPRVLVFGNGLLGAAIVDELTRSNTSEAELVERLSLGDLRAQLDAHDLVVCALEDTRYRALLDVNDAALATGRPCIPVVVDGEDVVLGPTVVRTQRACFGCAVLGTTLSKYPDRARAAEYATELSTRRLAESPLLHAAARAVRDEVARVGVDPFLAGRLMRLSDEGVALSDVPVRQDCPFCRPRAREETAASAPPLTRKSSISISLNADRRAESEVRGNPKSGDAPYRTVGILGGGSAGYMTALALRTRRPELEVTLIESSKIPIIGVGEATTPRLLDFLHSRSGLDIVDFYRRVLPTWKLGIQFYWGLPGDYTFNGAFQFASLVEPMVYRGNMETYSLGCALMERDRVPVFANGDGTYTSFLHRIAFAYHLDNVRFVRYLTEEAERLGVRRLDRVIVDAAVKPDGENIDHLVDDGGEKHRFDLYVDASGFRSFLLEKKLGSPYVSYAPSLFTDSALMADVPNHGNIRPYTRAETMDNGWCWTIPFHENDHRGYVFSSAFCSLDQATDEFRRKNPTAGDIRSLKFRSGRHEHFWRGNVLAVGNSYAFVEPLESTGLEMLSIELDLVVDHFPTSQNDRGVKAALSAKFARMWDDLRGLLAIHYKFNRKLDTEFWRACRRDTDLATAAPRVALFADRAPLSYSRALLRADDPVADFFSQDYIYDVLLCGQQVPATYLEPFETRAVLEERRRHYRAAAEWALPQAEALRLLTEEPETLISVFDSPESWIRLKRY
ncbi:MAG TPA: tryptophan halogenase family protein [Polyangiaceae bacterium]|jgi:tryptophan halogenase|nr:tryptophan halogenase family protein [Polyangiaceae bacterium]